MIKNFIKSKYLYLILIIFYSFLIYIQLQKSFGWDELEHIHSSYLVYKGEIPYKDFFQHHHPLTWYVYSLLFNIFGETKYVLIFIKLVSILIGGLNLFLLFKISKKFIDKKFFQHLVPIFASSSIFFMNNGMEIRPDNLMITFLLVSFIFLLKGINLEYENKRRLKYLLLSGLNLGIGFIFLQKIIIFWGIFNLILFTSKFKIKIKNLILSLMIFNLFFIVPFILFIVLIVKLNIWIEYDFFNWTLNAYFDDKFSAFRTITKDIELANLAFFGFYLLSLFYYLVKIKYVKDNINLFILLGLNLVYLALLFTYVRSPYSQYFLPISFFGSILISKFCEDYLVVDERYKQLTILFMIFASILPLLTYKYFIIKSYNFDKQVQDIINVKNLPDSVKSELSVQKDLNIFYKDHDYYWYSPEAQKTIEDLRSKGMVPKMIK